MTAPPHDLLAERALLGAVLLRPHQLAGITLDPAMFYAVGHQHIAASINALAAAGEPIDAVTVAAHLERSGLLDAAGGRAVVAELTADAVGLAAAPYAAIVEQHATSRRLIGVLLDALEAARHGRIADAAELATSVASIDTDALTERSSWDPVDLSPWIHGDITLPEPAILSRSDGRGLLYPGLIHAVNAEPESGKSWLALLACKQAISAGSAVLYVDWEDAPDRVVARLRGMGASAHDIAGLFHYVRPDEPIDAAARTRIMRVCDGHQPVLAVLDGVTEAMTTMGLSIMDNADVATFYDGLARPLARAGTAVLLVDHVRKDRDQRGRGGIGAQHKLAGITGASFQLEVIEPFRPGAGGRARLVVEKDRPGAIRAFAVGGRNVGELRIASSGDSVEVLIRPAVERDSSDGWVPTVLMERVSRAIEAANASGTEPTQREITRLVSGKQAHIVLALARLIEEGHVTTWPGARGALHHAIDHPYREALDPRSDRFDPTATATLDRDPGDF